MLSRCNGTRLTFKNQCRTGLSRTLDGFPVPVLRVGGAHPGAEQVELATPLLEHVGRGDACGGLHQRLLHACRVQQVPSAGSNSSQSSASHHHMDEARPRRDEEGRAVVNVIFSDMQLSCMVLDGHTQSRVPHRRDSGTDAAIWRIILRKVYNIGSSLYK